MYNPVSTYRIQFHKDFTFAGLRKVISYLHELGVGTLYASPVFSAVPGSTHGYDGLDPCRINPEIGTLRELEDCCRSLRNQGIGWLQDIVPNHMAYHYANAWLTDFLEKGNASAYAGFFDVYNDTGQEPVMAPFLDDTLENVIRKGELQVVHTSQRCCLQYSGQQYPLRLAAYDILFKGVQDLPDNLHSWLQTIREHTPDQVNELHERLAVLLQDPAIPALIQRNLERINRDHATLQALVESQYYRLCSWKEADRQINYRRFFTINGLICLRMQDEAVFRRYHEKITEMVAAGWFTGLRIDHIDGLYDPAGYLNRLRTLAGDDVYIAVEKILEPGEYMPRHWPVQGNTGYDFLSMVNQLLTNSKSAGRFRRFYRKLTAHDTGWESRLHRQKESMLYDHMGGELDHLFRTFRDSGLIREGIIEEQEDRLKEVIAAILIYCPVYRLYPDIIPLAEDQAGALASLLERVQTDRPWLLPLLQELHRLWLDPGDGAQHAKALHLLRRCMQFSGALMAKSKEDTLMYTFNRFLAHNEVGDSAGRFGMSVADFHAAMVHRQQENPLSLNATATHDTKRGEDVRARLLVLSDLAGEWLRLAGQWIKTNRNLAVPDDNEKYFLLQTIVGAMPMPGEPTERFRQRLAEYLPKALREAGIHSGWAAPDQAYEQQVLAFADAMLGPATSVWAGWADFCRKVADPGIVNSLVQLLLKCTCPGIPDIYQGAELWDLSLVDPDNRRPVDYTQRAQLLETLPLPGEQTPADLAALWEDRYSGRLKLWLTRTLLQLRRTHEALFRDGSYLPLEVKGRHKDHIMAFARRQERKWLVVVAGLHTGSLCRIQETGPRELDWSDTCLVLPPEAPRNYRHMLDGTGGRSDGTLPVAVLFRSLPVAALLLQSPENRRQAGVLLAVTSLPSVFGIGDLGPAARDFVDFLSRSCQRIWQMLPLNPIEADTGYSPYGSISAMAGNQWLISPEDLVNDGLLDKELLSRYRLPDSNRVDYEEAISTKRVLLDLAYERFLNDKSRLSALHTAFERFCIQEAAWLDHFALFATLRDHFKASWIQWPAPYRDRNAAALREWQQQHSAALHKVRWMQFVFHRQWQQLRTYCQVQGVTLLGDLPFYVSHDSADVWAYPEIFNLDDQRKTRAQAGVPPDYFSEDGQLWGMPTYNWAYLRDSGYDWWIKRLQRSLDLFDKVRLDHFRAFHTYWEVAAGERTARNGSWRKGPGKDFFDRVQAQLGRLPFVAEDLGDEMEPAYALRDAVGLPGMKVLQFAFGAQMPRLPDIPHNYPNNCIVYTGTHDNNTTVGWYNQEAGRADHKRMERYVNSRVRVKNVHEVLGRMAYASAADTVILPVQDILGLDAGSRMNTPGTGRGNWTWRLHDGQLHAAIEKRLREWAVLFNRV